MLPRAVKFDQCLRVTVKVDLNFGSSKFGKALRASVGWNFVVASQLKKGDIEMMVICGVATISPLRPVTPLVIRKVCI